MCMRKECVYMEIIELPTGKKIYVHYKRQNNEYEILWIDY